MSHPRRPPRVNVSRLVLGLLIIAVGVIFTLGRMRDLDPEDYLHLWPVALMVVGLAQLADARTRLRLAAALVWIAAGAWQLAHNLGHLPYSLSDLFPLVLALVGLSVLRPRGAAAHSGDESWLTGVVIMGGLVRTASSKSFRGGDLTAVMGGCEVDLRAAALAGEEAELHVFALWGGVDVRVPEGWSVDMRALALLGDATDKTLPPAGEPTGRLVVRGFVVMGGVEVKS